MRNSNFVQNAPKSTLDHFFCYNFVPRLILLWFKNENDMPEGSQTVRIVREGISCWLEDDQIDYNSRMYLASLPAVETKEWQGDWPWPGWVWWDGLLAKIRNKRRKEKENRWNNDRRNQELTTRWQERFREEKKKPEILENLEREKGTKGSEKRNGKSKN